MRSTGSSSRLLQLFNGGRRRRRQRILTWPVSPPLTEQNGRRRFQDYVLLETNRSSPSCRRFLSTKNATKQTTGKHDSATITTTMTTEEWNSQAREFLENSRGQDGLETLLEQTRRQHQRSERNAEDFYLSIESLMDSLVYCHYHHNHTKHSNSSPRAPLDSALAWELLDRALELENAVRQEYASDSSAWLIQNNQTTANQYLNVALQLWRKQLAERNNSKKTYARDDVMTTTQVLDKLDSIRSTSSALISPPDVQSYNIVMEAASRDDVVFCTKLWDWMWQESAQDPLVRPDVVTLRTLMKAWVKSGHSDAPVYCEGLVDEWIQNTSSSSGIRKSLIHVWALQDPVQAEAYLKDMIHRQENNNNNNSNNNGTARTDKEDLPDTIAWNRVISAYAITHGRPEDAARLLNEFWKYSRAQRSSNEHDNNDGVDHYQPDLFSYNSVLEGWARVGNTDQANRTIQQLQRASSTSPNIISYTSAMKANVAVNDLQQVEKLAMEYLAALDEELQTRNQTTGYSLDTAASPHEQLSPTQAEELQEEHQPHHLILDAAFFNTWLSAYTQITDDGTGVVDEALSILNEMKRRQVVPDKVTYLSLFRCFVSSNENHRAQEWLLEHARDMDEASLVSFVSRLVTWNSSNGIDSMSLLQELYEQDYLTEIGSWDRLLSQLLANQGKAVLEWMKSPTTKSYSLVLRALANDSSNSNSGQEAESLFRKWQKKGQQQENTNQSDGSLLEEDSLLADMYTSVIVGWSKSGNVERALSWYEEWASAKHSSTAVLPPPNQTAQTAVISTFARVQDAKGAEEFLRRLERDYHQGKLDDLPDVVMHNIVLNAWAKSGSAKRAERLLNAMEEKNTVSYNTVINAYVKKGKMKRAEELTADLVDSFRRHSDDRCRPDQVTFRSLLSGYARTKDPKASERAGRLLSWMKTLYKEGILRDSPESKSYQMVLERVAKSNNSG